MQHVSCGLGTRGHLATSGFPGPNSTLALAAAAGDWAAGEARAAARPGEEGGEEGAEDEDEVYGDFEDLETGKPCCSLLQRWVANRRVACCALPCLYKLISTECSG